MRGDDAFILSCKNGYLEIAQWLYINGADIYAQNNLAFKCGRKNILKWLNSL